MPFPTMSSDVYLMCVSFFPLSAVPMSDPRAPMRGGVPPPGPTGVPPRGLLGDGPNDPRGGTLLNVTGDVVEPRYDYKHMCMKVRKGLCVCVCVCDCVSVFLSLWPQIYHQKIELP